jgi:hypothetical protein
MFIVAERGSYSNLKSPHNERYGCQGTRLRPLAMELNTRERGLGILGQLEIELAAS